MMYGALIVYTMLTLEDICMDKFFIYKLVRQNEKTNYNFVDLDLDSAPSEGAVYYGLTQNPQKRLSQHRPKKGIDISLTVIAEFESVWFALEHEAKVIADHVRKYGKAPELQGMANSGVKATPNGGGQ